ncbi:hypothetical protein [Devosia sp.]|uniref:hypothetical protein n=1 Tax=Devosia sp. TaxID=1871048 RepID=UPI0032630EC2
MPERYAVTVFNGVTAVRSIDCSMPSAIYSATQQAADFGALPTSFSFKIGQVSPVYGPGHAATGVFNG